MAAASQKADIPDRIEAELLAAALEGDVDACRELERRGAW